MAGTVPVTGPLSTKYNNDTYPTHNQDLGLGGYRGGLASLSDVYNIPIERRRNLMLVGVKYYNGGPALFWLNAPSESSTDLANNDYWQLIDVGQTLQGGITYKGTVSMVNGTTNTGLVLSDVDPVVPTDVQNGWFWVVSAAGVYNFGSGNVTASLNDWIIYDGLVYNKISQATAVDWNTLSGKPTLITDWLADPTKYALTADLDALEATVLALNVPTVTTDVFTGTTEVPTAQAVKDWGYDQATIDAALATLYTDTQTWVATNYYNKSYIDQLVLDLTGLDPNLFWKVADGATLTGSNTITMGAYDVLFTGTGTMTIDSPFVINSTAATATTLVNTNKQTITITGGANSDAGLGYYDYYTVPAGPLDTETFLFGIEKSIISVFEDGGNPGDWWVGAKVRFRAATNAWTYNGTRDFIGYDGDIDWLTIGASDNYASDTDKVYNLMFHSRNHMNFTSSGGNGTIQLLTHASGDTTDNSTIYLSRLNGGLAGMGVGHASSTKKAAYLYAGSATSWSGVSPVSFVAELAANNATITDVHTYISSTIGPAVPAAGFGGRIKYRSQTVGSGAYFDAGGLEYSWIVSARAQINHYGVKAGGNRNYIQYNANTDTLSFEDNSGLYTLGDIFNNWTLASGGTLSGNNLITMGANDVRFSANNSAAVWDVLNTATYNPGTSAVVTHNSISLNVDDFNNDGNGAYWEMQKSTSSWYIYNTPSWYAGFELGSTTKMFSYAESGSFGGSYIHVAYNTHMNLRIESSQSAGDIYIWNQRTAGEVFVTAGAAITLNAPSIGSLGTVTGTGNQFFRIDAPTINMATGAYYGWYMNIAETVAPAGPNYAMMIDVAGSTVVSVTSTGELYTLSMHVFEEQTAPGTPSVSQGYLYMNSADEKLYFKSSTATYDLTSQGAFSVDAQTQITPNTALDLDEVSGNEIALDLSTIVDKTAGNATIINIDITDTTSNGSLHFMDLSVGGTALMFIDETGDINLNPSDGSSSAKLLLGVNDYLAMVANSLQVYVNGSSRFDFGSGSGTYFKASHLTGGSSSGGKATMWNISTPSISSVGFGFYTDTDTGLSHGNTDDNQLGILAGGAQVITLQGGTTDHITFFGAQPASYGTSADGVMYIYNAVANPAGDPSAGGGVLYADGGDSGKLKWRVGSTTHDLTAGGALPAGTGTEFQYRTGASTFGGIGEVNVTNNSYVIGGSAGSTTGITGTYGFGFQVFGGGIADYEIAIGYAAADASGAHGGNSISIGKQANDGTGTLGQDTIAIGTSTLTPALGGTAIGFAARAQATYQIALGYNAGNNGGGTNGTQTISIGYEANSNGTNTIGQYGFAAGPLAQTVGNYQVAIGHSAGSTTGTATGVHAVSIGWNANAGTLAIGADSVAVGGNAESSSDYAVALGGYSRASGQYSMALGPWAYATGTYSAMLGIENGTAITNPITYSLGIGFAEADPSYWIRGGSVHTVTTTNTATATNCGTLTLDDNSVYLFEVMVVGRRTDSGSENMYTTLIFGAYRQGAGSATLIGSVQTDATAKTTATNWTITADVSGNDVRIRVAGDATHTVNWRAVMKFTRVK